MSFVEGTHGEVIETSSPMIERVKEQLPSPLSQEKNHCSSVGSCRRVSHSGPNNEAQTPRNTPGSILQNLSGDTALARY